MSTRSVVAFTLQQHFVVFSCNGCLIVLLTDYAHDNIFQELPSKIDYFDSFSGIVYTDVRDSKGDTRKLEKSKGMIAISSTLIPKSCNYQRNGIEIF